MIKDRYRHSTCRRSHTCARCHEPIYPNERVLIKETIIMMVGEKEDWSQPLKNYYCQPCEIHVLPDQKDHENATHKLP